MEQTILLSGAETDKSSKSIYALTGKGVTYAEIYIYKNGFVVYNVNGDKHRLIVWKPCVSVKSSESYCEWNR